jgi:diaminobutyrate-2-oxoglutarate transaminase
MNGKYMQSSIDNVSTFDRHESSARSYCHRFPMVVTRASGSYLYDERGERYIDFLSCAGAVNYGHNPAPLKEALIAYLAEEGIQAALDMFTAAKRTFIDTFVETILQPRAMDYRLQFTGPTGTSVVESAVKLARKLTRRRNVIAFTNGFHGMSGTSLGLTGNRYHRQEVQDANVTRIPFDAYLGREFNTVAYLRRLLEDGSSGIDLPAAVIVETVQGEGGVNVASAQWLRELRVLTREYGIHLIIDDIQAGCGRTGDFFSFEFAAIAPDLVCLSKSLSGYGLPFSLLLIRPELDQWQPAEDNGTFRGNTLAFVSATAALETYWRTDALSAKIRHSEAAVRTVLLGLQNKFPGAIKALRGRGLFYGMEFFAPAVAAAVAGECLRLGLIIERCGAEDQVLKIMPALTIDEITLQKGLHIIAAAVGTAVAAYDPAPALVVAL